MNIGIIRAGHIGSTLARLRVDAGHEVALSNSRGPETLTARVDELGAHARAGAADDAAGFGQVAAGLIRDIGFGPLGTGSLRHSRVQEPGAAIYNNGRRRPGRWWAEGNLGRIPAELDATRRSPPHAGRSGEHPAPGEPRQ